MVATEAPAPAAPGGVLTYVRDGQYISIPVDDPGAPLVSAAIGPEDHSSAHHRPTTAASPDGRYQANIVSDDQGTRIEVSAGGHIVQTILIASAEGVDLVANPKSLARAVEGVPLAIAWSPDSKYLAYGSIIGAPWTLHLFSTSTWASVQYEVEGGYVGELAWSPDSARLAISTYELERTNHTVLVLDTRANDVERLIGGCIVVWSPDGNFVAVRREPLEEPGVWIAPIEDGSQIRVTADTKSYPVAWTTEEMSPLSAALQQ
jgi:WD40 repeat protein